MKSTKSVFHRRGIITVPLLFLFLLVLPLSSAAVNLDIPLPTALGNSYGTFEVGSNITLLQTCTNLTAFCDYCNLTSLKFDGDVLVVANVAMDKNTALFNYTLDSSLTQKAGHYTITGFCIGGGVYSPFAYTFEVNQEGIPLTSTFFWLIIVLGFGLVIFGLWKEDYTLTTLGSFALVFVGLYLLYYGIADVKNAMSNGIAIVTLAVAGYILASTGLNFVRDNYD